MILLILIGLLIVIVRPWESEPEYDFSRGSVFPEYM
jgi:hypothetical protein